MHWPATHSASGPQGGEQASSPPSGVPSGRHNPCSEHTSPNGQSWLLKQGISSLVRPHPAADDASATNATTESRASAAREVRGVCIVDERFLSLGTRAS